MLPCFLLVSSDGCSQFSSDAMLTLLEPVLIVLVGGLISVPGTRQSWFLYDSKWAYFTRKFGPALHRPSPTTCPENDTNPSADLVEAYL